MITLGVILAMLAYLQYKKNEKQINNSLYVSSSWLSLFITFIILTGGVVLILYLVSIT